MIYPSFLGKYSLLEPIFPNRHTQSTGLQVSLILLKASLRTFEPMLGYLSASRVSPAYVLSSSYCFGTVLETGMAAHHPHHP